MKHFCGLLIVSLSFLLTGEAKAQAPAAGKVVDRIACAADNNQTYALYLPSAYTPDKRWPILYAFDPGARGLVPVERFKEAAEKYGYILAGSNNSRNGPWTPTLAAIRALWDDTHARFSIDEARVYAAGFSGGARVASQLGFMLKGGVAGVIACGAGFPTEISPSASTPFVLFGIAGFEDFNYPELKRLERALSAAGIANRFAAFEGGHAWPPSDLCASAVEWMELQAIKSGKHYRNEALVESLLKKNTDSATADEAAGRLYEAYVTYHNIARDFKGLRDVAPFEKKSESLRASKAVKQGLKQESEQESEQRTRVRELFRLRGSLRDRRVAAALAEGEPMQQTPTAQMTPMSGMSDSQSMSPSMSPTVSPTMSPTMDRPVTGEEGDTRHIAMADLKRALADLKKKSDAKESGLQRAISRRVLNEFLISSYELSSALLRSKKYELAAAELAIDSELMPDNWRVSYNLACAYSLAGDKRKSIEALKKAVRAGFNNAAELDGNKDLDPLREERGFREIVDQLKKGT